jgi:tetratricopeptide (TPR) repeat protein
MAKGAGGLARQGQPFETWQVGAARLPFWVARRGSEPRRAWIAICVSLDSGAILPSDPGPEEEVPRLLESVVSQAARKWHVRPRLVQVPETAWAPGLERALSPQGVEVEVQAHLPLLREILEDLPRRMAEDDPRPGILTGAGATPDRVAALARAAAGFMAASGWRHLNEADLIRIEAPDAEAELRFLVLSHVGGTSAPKLLFLRDVVDFEAVLADDEELDDDDFPDDEEDVWEEGGREEAGRNPGVWVVELLPPWYAPPEDVDLWECHGLPWAGKGFLPLAMFLAPEGERRPDHRQLAFFEGLFATLATTSEEDLDAGRWEKRVSTAEGEARFVLSLPDLLAPAETAPGPPNPLSALRFLEQSMRRSEREPTDGPSLQDRAEDLLERAYQARGHRATLLARQALEVWPDCADAYNLLARRAPDPESRARLYELGMAAGERAIGPEAFEDAGHFWGLLETRPYMRARLGLAETLANQGRLGEAAEHFQEMLRLNPGDNQGVRHTLVNLLIALDRDEEAWKLADSYPDDGALLEFPRALLRFRGEGDSPEARKSLKQAVRANRFVPGVLLGTREPSPQAGYYSPGRESEAALYLDLSLDTWAGTKGALAWLRARTAPPPRPKSKGKRKKARR